MQDSSEPHHNESELNEQIAIRKQKLEFLQSTKNTAFPNDFKPSHLAATITSQYNESSTDELAQKEIAVMIAGRMMTRRLMGKASFFNLQDSSGQIQVYVNLKDLNEETYEAFKSWDLGDIIGLSGILFRTKTNELSVRTESINLLCKSLRPLPNKWQGLQDLEICYRQRYLDLIVNQKSKQTFLLRSKAIQAMRMFFLSKDYLEVETPMMHPIPGGAAAKPFVTHHNALDMTLYLRIAPELYLKRLVVGGMERVFEINRNFRNEGLSTRHNPEFTMIEFYQAYSTYHDLMDLTEELFKYLLTALNLPHKLPYQGGFLDFGKKFSRLTMRDAVKLHNPKLSEEDMVSCTRLAGYLKHLGQHTEASWGLGRLQMEIFEATVETKLQDPTFITEYPIEVSPLARRSDDNHEVCDRAELFIAGRELANIFSELNDPIDQAKRFQAQASEKEAGDEEAMAYDADYVRALEYGLPPTAGEGIGIDRLIMLLSDSPAIRDVLLFPQMRATTIA